MFVRTPQWPKLAREVIVHHWSELKPVGDPISHAASKISVRIASLILCSAASLTTSQVIAESTETPNTGSRPAELIALLPGGELRSKLESCATNTTVRTDFSIGHRGAPLGYPEHTREGYIAAAEMGAGILECDVTFTSDKALVCRHSQCDLHTTTNILQTPLAESCTTPPDYNSRTPFENVQCCTSDLTVDEFKSLRGKADFGNKKAATLEEYLSLAGTPKAALADVTGTLMTHKESISLFSELGVRMIPELKAPMVDMPFEGEFTQQQYAQSLVDEYVNSQIDPADVFLQSFNLNDVHYWLEATPEFGKQAAWLDGRYRDRSFDASQEKSWKPSMSELADSGVKILAPPMWMLLTLGRDNTIEPSSYAIAAAAADLDIITWTLERSGSLNNGGGWYYQSVKKAIKSDGDIYSVLDSLARKVKVKGIFTDWPATVTYYANCFGIE